MEIRLIRSTLPTESQLDTACLLLVLLIILGVVPRTGIYESFQVKLPGCTMS